MMSIYFGYMLNFSLGFFIWLLFYIHHFSLLFRPEIVYPAAVELTWPRYQLHQAIHSVQKVFVYELSQNTMVALKLPQLCHSGLGITFLNN